MARAFSRSERALVVCSDARESTSLGTFVSVPV